MLLDNAIEVKLSEVELDQVTSNEIKTVFVPMEKYENEKRIFNENYPDGESEMEMFYEILFSVYVTKNNQPGVLLFMYR